VYLFIIFTILFLTRKLQPNFFGQKFVGFMVKVIQ
jgi:hypothetical protein